MLNSGWVVGMCFFLRGGFVRESFAEEGVGVDSIEDEVAGSDTDGMERIVR